MRRALDMFGGGVLVYVLVAACSGPPPAGSYEPGGDAGPNAQAEAGGAGSEAPDAVAGPLDAWVEAMANPVPEAKADVGPTPPTVIFARCDVPGKNGSLFAEASFPGKSVNDLAMVRAVLSYDPSSEVYFSVPDGWDSLVTNTYLKPGRVLASCGSAQIMNPSVAFILP